MMTTRRSFLKQLATIIPGTWLADKLPVQSAVPDYYFTPLEAPTLPAPASTPIGMYSGNGEVLVSGVFRGGNLYEGDFAYTQEYDVPDNFFVGDFLAIDEDGQIVGYGGGD